MNNTNLSKFISLILRHKPEIIGVSLDKHGWCNVQALLIGINNASDYTINMKTLEEIVLTDNKQRYSFNQDKTLIRANQGHSINVEVDLQETKPPKLLYHGTAKKYLANIQEQGLVPKSRLYVHLSSDLDTAISVGKRHGEVVVLQINTEQMYKDNYKFYLSINNVWLTKQVPSQYITVI